MATQDLPSEKHILKIKVDNKKFKHRKKNGKKFSKELNCKKYSW